MGMMGTASGDAPGTTSETTTPGFGDVIVEDPETLDVGGDEKVGTSELGKDSKIDEQKPSEFLDMSKYGDYLTEVTIDGEKVQIPLKELPGGWMRQADYTRKTQAAAEAQRQYDEVRPLVEALQSDPMEFARQVLQYAGGEGAEEGASIQPWERRMSEYEREIADLRSWVEDQRVDAYVRETGNSLREMHDANVDKFGTYDVGEVARFMQENGIIDPAVATKLYLFDRAGNELSLINEQRNQNNADAARSELKRSSPAVTGGGVTHEGKPGPAKPHYASIEEAAYAAVEAIRRK